MLAIVALGVQQAVVGNYQALLWWLLPTAPLPAAIQAQRDPVQHQDCEEHDEDEFEELDGMHAVQALQSR